MVISFFSFYLFSVSLLLLRYDLWPRIRPFLKKKRWWFKVLSSLLYIILKLPMVKKIRVKHLKHSLMDQWINKMWYIHIMKCCSAFYKKESKFWHTTTWVNLDSMVGEQQKKRIVTKGWYYMILLTWGTWKVV